MKYYGIVEVNVTDSSWVPEYLARTSQIEMVEGDTDVHQTSVLLEFPSKGSAYSFYNSAEYQPLRDARIAGSTGTFYFVAGENG